MVVKKDRFNGAQGEEREKLIKEEAAKKGFTIIPNKITPLNINDVKNGLINIISNRFKDLPDDMIHAFANVLLAQIKLETGLKSSHCWNVGNIHATSNSKNEFWKGLVAVWDDPQVDKSGQKYINVDWFWRAYSSLEEGLGDYYLFLEKKFPAAIEYAKQGDAYNFGMALGKAGYYTANKQTYSKGLAKIVSGFN